MFHSSSFCPWIVFSVANKCLVQRPVVLNENKKMEHLYIHYHETNHRCLQIKTVWYDSMNRYRTLSLLVKMKWKLIFVPDFLKYNWLHWYIAHMKRFGLDNSCKMHFFLISSGFISFIKLKIEVSELISC